MVDEVPYKIVKKKSKFWLAIPVLVSLINLSLIRLFGSSLNSDELSFIAIFPIAVEILTFGFAVNYWSGGGAKYEKINTDIKIYILAILGLLFGEIFEENLIIIIAVSALLSIWIKRIIKKRQNGEEARVNILDIPIFILLYTVIVINEYELMYIFYAVVLYLATNALLTNYNNNEEFLNFNIKERAKWMLMANMGVIGQFIIFSSFQNIFDSYTIFYIWKLTMISGYFVAYVFRYMPKVMFEGKSDNHVRKLNFITPMLIILFLIIDPDVDVYENIVFIGMCVVYQSLRFDITKNALKNTKYGLKYLSMKTITGSLVILSTFAFLESNPEIGLILFYIALAAYDFIYKFVRPKYA